MSIPDADMRVSTQGSFSADTIILENGRDPASVAKETRRRRSTVSSTNSSSEDPRLRRRLVPDDLRKRTSMSCDLCKTRRVKCERTPSASSKAEPGPCRNCIKLGVMCKSSLPRKKRIYGNAENLGVRYRMLDALVEQLLPGEDTSDIRSLREIARRFQIQTPDVEHNEFLDNSIAEATEESTLTNSIASGSPSPMIVEERSATAIHQEPDNVTPPNVSQLSENTGQGPSEDDKNPFCDRVHRRAKIHSSAGAEKLYTNTQGMPSYLGPSSSFKFMIRLRETLIDGGWKNKKGRSSGKHGGDSNKGDNVTGATNERLRREFATSRVSKAIEGQSVSATEDYGDGDEPGQAATRSRGEASTLDIRIGAGQDAATTTIADNSHAINRDLSSSTTSRIHNPLKLDLASNSFSSILKYAQDALPARETADALVEAFFDQVHPSYVVFHRGTFQLHYESLFLCSSDDEDDDKAEARDYPQLRIGADWICSIFMVFIFGAQVLEHRDRRRALVFQQRFFKLFQALLFQVMSTTSLPSIQALLLAQLYLHNSSERNASWMLLGCACRMAISLGMHRDGVNGGFDPIERELRRKVWWTMYTFEQELCLTLGRPSAILGDEEINVELPNEAMMDGQSSSPPGYLIQSISLTKISNNVRRELFAVVAGSEHGSTRVKGSHSPTDDLPPETARRLLGQLEEWHHNLPNRLSIENSAPGSTHYRAVHILHLRYHYLKQVVTRSYVLRAVEARLANTNGNDAGLQDPTETTVGELSDICLTSAVSSISVLTRLMSSDQLDGVAWWDHYYAYHSGIILLINHLQLNRHRELREVNGETLVAANGFLHTSREAVSALVKIMQHPRLCKTMRLFANVTLQLAKIVGVLGHDDPSGDNGVEFSTQQRSNSAMPDSQPFVGGNQSTAPSPYDWLEHMLANPDSLFYNPDVNGLGSGDLFEQTGTGPGLAATLGRGNGMTGSAPFNVFSPYQPFLLSPPYSTSNLSTGVDNVMDFSIGSLTDKTTSVPQSSQNRQSDLMTGTTDNQEVYGTNIY